MGLKSKFASFFSLLITLLSFQGGYKINFEYSDLEYDENLMNIDLQMKKHDDKTVVNVKSELYENIDEEMIAHVSHYEKVKNDYEHLVNTSINICNILSRVKTHPILRIIIKELTKTSNFPSSCPVKKGIYHMKDFTLNDEFLPPFLPEGKFMSNVQLNRLDDGEEISVLRMTIFIEIEYQKDRKIKFFK